MINLPSRYPSVRAPATLPALVYSTSLFIERSWTCDTAKSPNPSWHLSLSRHNTSQEYLTMSGFKKIVDAVQAASASSPAYCRELTDIRPGSRANTTNRFPSPYYPLRSAITWECSPASDKLKHWRNFVVSTKRIKPCWGRYPIIHRNSVPITQLQARPGQDPAMPTGDCLGLWVYMGSTSVLMAPVPTRGSWQIRNINEQM